MANKDFGIDGVPTNPVDAKIQENADTLSKTGVRPEASSYIDRITQATGYGNLRSAITATYWGLNHRGFGNPVPANNEQEGLIFLTRPRLNLSYDNIKNVRKLNALLNPNPRTKERAIRAYLDPDGSRVYYPSDLVDPLNPFICLLSNNFISVTGWPDPSVDAYTSEAGLYGQQWAMVDGVPELNGVYDMSFNFRNIVDDPITYMMHIWSLYAGYVHEGRLTPRPDSILENEIDYMSRAYKLNFDPTRTYVTRISCTGAGFFTTDNTGAAFNTSENGVFIRDLDQVSAQYKAICIEYYDLIVVKEFNEVVVLFNPSMADGIREKTYIPLPNGLKPYFNYQGYPRINPFTSEFEIWVSKEQYAETLKNAIIPPDLSLLRK